MAGRGTDIVLGGNLDMELEALEVTSEAKRKTARIWKKRQQKVLDAGDLRVVGTDAMIAAYRQPVRGRSGGRAIPVPAAFICPWKTV